MRIDELDEFQGLTVDMVRQWLTKHGWEVRECGNGSTDAKKRFTDRVSVLGCDWDSCLGWLLARVAAAERMSVQTLLREINPRMRKGMPSEAAINACPFWLVRDSETHEIELHLARKGRLYALCDCAEKLGGRVVVDVLQGIVMEWERLSPLNLKDFGDVMQFWPCDEHGNKVRWPTDAEGKML